MPEGRVTLFLQRRTLLTEQSFCRINFFYVIQTVSQINENEFLSNSIPSSSKKRKIEIIVSDANVNRNISRGYPLSTYAKFSEKLTFLTP